MGETTQGLAGGVLELERGGIIAGGEAKRGKAEALREVVPHADIGARGGRSGGDFTDEADGAEGHGGAVAVAAAVVGGDHGTDEGDLADGIGGALKHSFAAENIIHDAPAARGGLEVEIVVDGEVYRLAVDVERGGVGGGIFGEEFELFAVFAAAVFARAGTVFGENKDVGGGIVGGEL